MSKISKKSVQYAKQRLKYKKDPIRFIEDMIYIPTPGGSRLLKMYEPQKEMVASFFRDHHLILLKTRQIGMSTIVQAIMTYVCTFYDNCVMGIVSKDGKEASDFCRKIQSMIGELPEWIRPRYKNKSVQYFVLENGCEVHSATVSPVNPSNVFRGKSITFLILDEAAFISHVDEAWTGMMPSVSKAQSDAASRNIPYGTVIISTPNVPEGTGKWYHQVWSNAYKGDSVFKPFKIHWTDIAQFRDDPEWYKHQCALLNNDKNKIAQELDCKFVGSKECLFEEDIQILLQQNKEDPLGYISIPTIKNKITMFSKPNRKNFHLIAVDPSSAAGFDNTAIEVIEYETMRQIFEFCAKIDPKKIGDVVKMIASQIPNNLIIVENTGGYGSPVLDSLLNDINMKFNVYGEYKDTRNGRNYIPGFNTNVKTRPLILDALFETVNSDPSIIQSPILSSELLSLVNKRNRVEAASGFNDDCAMAFGIACYFRKYENSALSSKPFTDEEIEQLTILRDNSLSYTSSLNGFIPFSNIYDNIDDGKNDLDKYLRDRVMSGELSGRINILEMIYDK